MELLVCHTQALLFGGKSMDPRQRNDKIIVALLSNEKMERCDREEAGRLLYDEYLPGLYAFLRTRDIRSPRLLDQIVIETIERVTQKIKTFHAGNASFMGFLIGYAILVAREKGRKELETDNIEIGRASCRERV
jgi:hypothetical protein